MLLHGGSRGGVIVVKWLTMHQHTTNVCFHQYGYITNVMKHMFQPSNTTHRVVSFICNSSGFGLRLVDRCHHVSRGKQECKWNLRGFRSAGGNVLLVWNQKDHLKQLVLLFAKRLVRPTQFASSKTHWRQNLHTNKPAALVWVALSKVNLQFFPWGWWVHPRLSSSDQSGHRSKFEAPVSLSPCVSCECPGDSSKSCIQIRERRAGTSGRI